MQEKLIALEIYRAFFPKGSHKRNCPESLEKCKAVAGRILNIIRSKERRNAMNEKLLKELREWDEKYCDGELCFDSRDKFREILSRHEQEQGGDSLEALTHRVSMYSQIINNQADEIAKLKAKTEVEPLAAIIAKAGFWYHTIYHHADGEWDIRLGTNSRNALSTEERFNAPTYPAAEQSARRFLEGLPNKGGK